MNDHPFQVQDRLVAARFAAAAYCSDPPYHPDAAFPELPFAPPGPAANPVYPMLRQLWLDLGLDTARHGRPDWNPLGALITPGQTVLLKPNFVSHMNHSGDDLFAVVTHPSLLRALADYVYVALQGRGRIVIADAPEMGCNWARLMERMQLESVQRWYREQLGFTLEVYDLRDFELTEADGPAYASRRIPLPGDPAGSTLINLAGRSEFAGLPSDRYYGADYDRQETIRHHHDDVHHYCISNTFLQADTVISVPKMKVHKKVGVTLNLKGLVGVNTNKNCLIHYRIGSPREQGDQLPDSLPGGDRLLVRMQRWLFDRLLARQDRLGDALYTACRAVYRHCVKPLRPVSRATQALDGGNWHGNDSAWRMTADLAKILFFADREGRLQSERQRRLLCVVDGIVAGENEGPLAPTAKFGGCLVAGFNPFAVDLVTTRLMGLDGARIKQFGVLGRPDWNFGFQRPEELTVLVGGAPVAAPLFFTPRWHSPLPAFLAHVGWRGKLELPAPASTSPS